MWWCIHTTVDIWVFKPLETYTLDAEDETSMLYRLNYSGSVCTTSDFHVSLEAQNTQKPIIAVVI